MISRTEFEKAATQAEAAIEAYERLDLGNLGTSAYRAAAQPLMETYHHFLDMPAPDLEGLETKARLVLETNAGYFANPEWWDDVPQREMVPLIQDIINVAGRTRTGKRPKPVAMMTAIQDMQRHAERGHMALCEILNRHRLLMSELHELNKEARGETEQ